MMREIKMKKTHISKFLDEIHLITRDSQENGATASRCIEVEGHSMPACFKFHGNRKLVVFFPGAHALNQPKPKFQRSGYFRTLDCNCISLFDPTLFLSEDLHLGWFQGGGRIPHFRRAEVLITTVADAIGIEHKDIILFGTSAGGIPAIKVSEGLTGCSVFVGNPQTDVKKYYKPSVDRLVSALSNESELQNIQKERFSVIGSSTTANIFYAQNIQDRFHLIGHMQPFKSARPELNYIIYDHPTGHNPIGSDIEIRVIEKMLREESPEILYRDFLP
jgi:hypothetical protein